MKINDKIDTQEAGGQVIVNVKVKGIQISPNFSLKRVQVTSLKNDVYEAGDTVNFAMEFTENVYGGNNKGSVTNANAPVVTVGFGGTSANSPVAKVASLMQTNLKLSAGENVATFVSASGNKINYSYTLKSGDSGVFRIAGITGSVYNRDGKEINFTTVQSVPEVIGGTVTTEAPVVIPINNPTTTPTGTEVTPTPEPTPTATPTPAEATAQITVGGQTVTLTKENVADYYGKVVTNYSATNSATWRLFYVDFDGDFGDEGKIYLKADQVTETSLNTGEPSTIALNKMKEMNKDWATNDGTVNNNNEQAVLWLCDETKWSGYKNSSYADYVMGAPSIEMYVKSYNAYHTKKGTSGYEQIKCKWFSSSVSGYKYAVGASNESYVDCLETNGLKADSNNMYVKSGQYWWLASPSAINSKAVCLVVRRLLRIAQRLL